MKEPTEMYKIIDEMQEFICDKICRYPYEITNQEELENKCCECKMGEYICGILNKYDKINDFDKSQAAMLMRKYKDVVFCEDCKFMEREDDFCWCRKQNGLDEDLQPGTGCTRGVEK